MRPSKDVYIQAAKLYDDMLESYRNFQFENKYIEDYDRFLQAATSLADLNLPNPFADLDGMTFYGNAPVRPSVTSNVVTSVMEV